MPHDGNLATYPNLGHSSSSSQTTWSNKTEDENGYVTYPSAHWELVFSFRSTLSYPAFQPIFLKVFVHILRYLIIVIFSEPYCIYGIPASFLLRSAAIVLWYINVGCRPRYAWYLNVATYRFTLMYQLSIYFLRKYSSPTTPRPGISAHLFHWIGFLLIHPCTFTNLSLLLELTGNKTQSQYVKRPENLRQKLRPNDKKRFGSRILTTTSASQARFAEFGTWWRPPVSLSHSMYSP